MADRFKVMAGSLISSPSSGYEVQSLLGSGTFGDVAQCIKLATNETVALKIIKKKSLIAVAKEEEAILQLMKELNTELFNIVKWNCSFIFEGRYCIEFEKLDISLYDFLQMRRSLELKEIRPIVQQLATALEFLGGIGIIHADLKPENIMMVDHVWQPLKVKVIDFGLAFCNPTQWRGACVQTLWYRSPEVLLGTPLSEAIDVWSLGCIVAELLKGTVLFHGFNAYDMMRHIYYMIGQPPSALLDAGLYTQQFFRATGLEAYKWRFMSPFEVRCSTMPHRFSSLSDLLKMSHNLSGEDAEAHECDLASFVDVVQKMLMVDSAERITATQILQHPFVTMSHLSGSFSDSLHVKSCKEVMSPSSHEGEDVDQEEASSSTAKDCQSESVQLSSKEQPLLKSTALFAKKRKRHGVDHRSPDITSANKKRRRQTQAGGKSSPQKSLKRKSNDAELCVSSAKKRKTEDLNKEVKDGVHKNTGEGPSNKRKRAGKEASGDKRRRVD